MSKENMTNKIVKALQSPITENGHFNLHAELAEVLEGVGLSPADSGGDITFYGKDPIVPSTLRLGSAAAIALAAKSVAIANIWRLRGGQGQDIHVDVRKALRRLSPFYDKKWEKLNGYVPSKANDPYNPLDFRFYQTRDEKWVMPLNPYPRAKHETLKLLNCTEDPQAVANAILQWDAADLERAGAERGIVMPVVRTVEEFMNEPVYSHIAQLPLIEIEKIGESEPIPFTSNASSPLDGIRALGLGHVIAGAGFGRALALHGADVLNVWRPSDWEHDVIYATSNVGMRSTTLDLGKQKEDQKMKQLLKDADIFFANRRYGFLERYGLSAEQCADTKPGIIHCSVNLHGPTGPWANRNGFDQTAGSVTGVMALEGSERAPKLPPIVVVNDYAVSWLLEVGALMALQRRAKEGGSYRVSVSLDRVSLWILSLGIFNKRYAYHTAGSSEEHAYVAPDLFTAETPLGEYEGLTEQVHMSETPGHYETVLVPRGSSKAEWLS
ncbi:L-carnitine dehydratase/bile acid-inducible protein F taxon [Fictibacillus macauensis ZFHKF-1]|uniref:L-carnitine dehydratase/bile acid-inducible protein F taxon n=1 Tax=Fictibacillus macauensis ZFHKF-1 TaxID=1196324 RepID=I8AHC2_9BACL|nr:CoA transferase [Fictibacillus macauensis]EIT84844.1 L-carnitine dehydratase/bile acid-inducible protein F taxon [Fictibacillus macauensis ZFHKF-1]